MNIKLTKKEEKAIASLKRIAKTWPETLWLFSASGSLCVMKLDDKGEKVMSTTQEQGNSYDYDYIVGSIDIPNDGGDW